VSAPTNDPDRAALDTRIAALERQHAIDAGVIEDLQAEGVVDRGMIANLEIALGGARRIGAAIGILMTSRKITDEKAFDLLRATSKREHRSLRDLAEDIVLSGALDDGEGQGDAPGT
jgi:hypothetical protein